MTDILRSALQEAIDVFVGMNDDEINEELLPRLKAALQVSDALEKCKYCGTGPCENCMNSGYAYPDQAELVLAGIELAKLPGDVYWLLAKGRTRPNEPLWAVQITDLDANKIAEAEGDHPADCVRAAWASALSSTHSPCEGK
jgi:hypothetical protein